MCEPKLRIHVQFIPQFHQQAIYIHRGPDAAHYREQHWEQSGLPVKVKRRLIYDPAV